MIVAIKPGDKLVVRLHSGDEPGEFTVFYGTHPEHPDSFIIQETARVIRSAKGECGEILYKAHIVRCQRPGCDKLAHTFRPETRFCSDRCKNAVAQREFRKRKKKAQ